jgi:hypothetical protein
VSNNFTLKLQIPKTVAEWKVIANGFNDQWNFPNCLGKVDGKRVSIKTNHHMQVHTTTINFFCFSILLMAVLNSNFEFVMADAGMNGRISDGSILGNTAFGIALIGKLLQIPEPGKR